MSVEKLEMYRLATKKMQADMLEMESEMHQEDNRLYAFLIIAAMAVIFIIVVQFIPTPKPVENVLDNQHLECRKAQGSWEYFGTQGYHCIGGKQ